MTFAPVVTFVIQAVAFLKVALLALIKTWRVSQVVKIVPRDFIAIPTQQHSLAMNAQQVIIARKEPHVLITNHAPLEHTTPRHKATPHWIVCHVNRAIIVLVMETVSPPTLAALDFTVQGEILRQCLLLHLVRQATSASRDPTI